MSRSQVPHFGRPLDQLSCYWWGRVIFLSHGQVSNAVDLSNLVQRIQDERAAIALNIFLDRPVSDDLRDLQLMVSNNVSLRKFTLVKVCRLQDLLLLRG